MKYCAFLSIALAGFASLAEAQPHGKLRHRHLNRRAIVTVYATQTVDQFGNHIGGPTPAPVPESPVANVPAPAQVLPEVSESEDVADEEEVVEDFEFAADVVTPPPADETPDVSDEDKVVVKAPTSGNGVSGLDDEFPDGELPCSHFPSDYGALATDWVTKDSWSGIQFDEKQASGEIRLANADGNGECKEGYYCSYACPPGYSKAQWPEDQPANGESVGGLKCQGGKLHLTRPNASKKLCVKGADNTKVVNKLDKEVAICRTDYPGTEKMSVPIVAKPGSTEKLTVPYAKDSYVWNNLPTTAQYYVNNAGVSVEEGCTWGTEGGGKGNWAPLVFGAGVNDAGATFLSVFQNPLNSEKANYNVKISAGNQECKFENGKFYGPGTENGSGTGCTVSATGKAEYIFY